MLSVNTSGDVVKCDAIMTYEAKGISAHHKRQRSLYVFIAWSGHFGGVWKRYVKSCTQNCGGCWGRSREERQTTNHF